MSNILQNLDWSVLADILISIIPALVCITFHELSHGFVAYKLGDNTAKNQGRLTLNPIKHIDIIGLLSMVIFKFGWAKPVPVDMRNFKNPKRDMAITALAGPVSNMILAAVVMVLYGVLWPFLENSAAGVMVLDTLNIIAYLSVALGIFNIIPVPPLDGSKVLYSVLSDEAYLKLMRYERYGMVVLLVLIWSGVLRTPLNAATGFVYDAFFSIAESIYKLVK